METRLQLLRRQRERKDRAAQRAAGEKHKALERRSLQRGVSAASVTWHARPARYCCRSARAWRLIASSGRSAAPAGAAADAPPPGGAARAARCACIWCHSDMSGDAATLWPGKPYCRGAADAIAVRGRACRPTARPKGAATRGGRCHAALPRFRRASRAPERRRLAHQAVPPASQSAALSRRRNDGAAATRSSGARVARRCGR